MPLIPSIWICDYVSWSHPYLLSKIQYIEDLNEKATKFRDDIFAAKDASHTQDMVKV
jgi:hypothetical protein